MTYPIDLLVPGDGSANGFTRCTTTREYNLGETRYDNVGKKYRYVQFKDAVTYAAGQCVTWAVATSLTTVTNDISGGSSIGSIPAGVVLGVPTQNQYGWIQTRGLYTTVATSGADDIAVGENVFVHGSTDGTVDGSAASAVTTTALGACVAADVDAANTVAVYITVG